MSLNELRPEKEWYQNEIKTDGKEKLLKVLDALMKEKKAAPFLEPVDYVSMNLLDYPKIITQPMDLGTVKENLINDKYIVFNGIINDLNLIWKNCRTYNSDGSDIVKYANYCEKKLNQLIDKQFKDHKVLKESSKSKNENSLLNLSDKSKFIEIIRDLTNEELTEIIKIILKECPKGIEDIDNEKLQIKIDLLDYRTFDIIQNYIAKIKAENKQQ